MTKYVTDPTLHFDTFSLRRDSHEIHINKVPAIKVHRELQELFDDPDWIFESSPSTRYTDELILILYPWAVVNPEDATVGELFMNPREYLVVQQYYHYPTNR